MCMPSGGGSGSGGAAQMQQQQEIQREQRIKKGNAAITSTFSQFDEPFYEGRTKAYEDWALPQLEDSFGDAKKNLLYGLSRSGMVDSTVANDKSARLQQDFNRNRIQIADQALAEATNARQAVQGAKMELQNQLTATADPSAAASNALASARTLNAANPLAAPAIAFQNVTADLANYGGGPATGYGGILGAPTAGWSGILPASGPSGAATVVRA